MTISDKNDTKRAAKQVMTFFFHPTMRGDLQKKKKVITCLAARFVSFLSEIVIEVGFAVIML